MAKKLKKKSIFEIFSKVEVQKLYICTCLLRLIKLDEKNIILEILSWEFLSGHLINIDHL
jgi:sulfur relay (sulfurtransferase) DsrF/TusC family protein